MTQQLRLDSELLQRPAPRPRGAGLEDFLATGVGYSDACRAVDCALVNRKWREEKRK